MFNWYARENDKAFAGMKADSSIDVCESFASEGGVNPGEAVIRGTDKAKQIKTATVEDVNKIIGVAVHNHKEITDSEKYFEEGYSVSVMTFGDIYVVAGGDVEAGDKVTITIDSEGEMFYTKAENGGIEGFTFLDNGTEGEVVRIRIRK